MKNKLFYLLTIILIVFLISCKKESQIENIVSFKPRSISIYSVDTNGVEKLQLKANYYYNNSEPLGIDSISIIDSIIHFGDFSSKFYNKIISDTNINNVVNKTGFIFFDEEKNEEINNHILYEIVGGNYKLTTHSTGTLNSSVGFFENYTFSDFFNLNSYKYSSYPSSQNLDYTNVENINDSIKISTLFSYADGSSLYDTAYYFNTYYDYPISILVNTYQNNLLSNFKGNKFDVISLIIPMSSKPSKLLNRIVYDNGNQIKYNYSFDNQNRITQLIRNNYFFGKDKIVLEY